MRFANLTAARRAGPWERAEDSDARLAVDGVVNTHIAAPSSLPGASDLLRVCLFGYGLINLIITEFWILLACWDLFLNLSTIARGEAKVYLCCATIYVHGKNMRWTSLPKGRFLLEWRNVFCDTLPPDPKEVLFYITV